MLTLLKNCRVLDLSRALSQSEEDVLIEDGRISEIGPSIASRHATTRNLAGRTVMPGMIDLHVHVTAISVSLAEAADASCSVVAHETFARMRRMLERGFTTVRDAGGADAALARLVEDGQLLGPTLFVSGRAISQTSGHGDLRSVAVHGSCTTCTTHRPLGSISRVADGVDGVRRATREELGAGAHQIKIMVSGGVASPADPILSTQFSAEEITAVVMEAEAWGTYVMAHAYAAPAIQRAVEAGVRTIEHANLVDRATAEAMAHHGVVAVPNLIAYDELYRRGPDLGMSSSEMSKLKPVRDAAVESLDILRSAGVALGFGTDLLGALEDQQSREFELRAAVLAPRDIVESVTTNASRVLGEPLLGTLAVGSPADLIVVDGDPLEDARVLGRHEQLVAVMKRGQFVVDRMAT